MHSDWLILCGNRALQDAWSTTSTPQVLNDALRQSRPCKAFHSEAPYSASRLNKSSDSVQRQRTVIVPASQSQACTFSTCVQAGQGDAVQAVCALVPDRLSRCKHHGSFWELSESRFLVRRQAGLLLRLDMHRSLTLTRISIHGSPESYFKSIGHTRWLLVTLSINVQFPRS
jgi:hypothetical protein